MVAEFNDKPSTTIIAYYSPTNASAETNLDTFYNDLSTLVPNISKHSVLVLIIRGDMNAKIGENVNNKFSFHNSSNKKWGTPYGFHTRKWINMPLW